MPNRIRLASLLVFSLVCVCSVNTRAQDERIQYPLPLQKSFFGVNVGVLSYPFSNKALPAGYNVEKISTPGEAVRITLFGYRFTKNLSARITYMRPVQWVNYKNVNGDYRNHSVWMNIGGLTARQSIPLSNKLSAFAEAGLAVITRHGFEINHRPVVNDMSYSTFSGGGGILYHLNSKWNFNLYGSYSPGKAVARQPHTAFVSGGFEYNIHPLADQMVIEKQAYSKAFPKQTFQFSYTTNTLGYGANHFFGEGKIPVFWGGNVAVDEGMAFNYRRNIFHTKKTFSLDMGASAGTWETNKNEQAFYALSLYPVMRFNIIRAELADIYFLYSVAGPTYISRSSLDDYDTGKHFTFRDYMGLGGYFGKQDAINAEIAIGHFSNGNVFPNNAGIKIPLSFSFGYAF